MNETGNVLDLTTELLVQIRNGVHELGEKLDATNARVGALERGQRAARVEREKMRTDLLATLAASERRLDAKIDRNTTRLDGVEQRLDGVESQQTTTNERLGQLVEHIGTLVERDAARGKMLERICERLDRLEEGAR